MSTASASPHYLDYFPLRVIPPDSQDALYKAVFNWIDCAQCSNAGKCGAGNCLWTQKRILGLYHQHYVDLTSCCSPRDWGTSHLALRSHDDLIIIIRLIENQPKTPRDVLIKKHFESYGTSQPIDVEKGRAFDLAFSTLTMIPCSESNHHLNSEPIAVWVTWKNDQTAEQLVRSTIPKATFMDPGIACRVLQSVSAEQLELAKIKIVATHKFHKHLYFDPRLRVVHIFVHVGFLRATLNARCDAFRPNNDIVPRDLALETIYTVADVIFRRTDFASSEVAARIKCDMGFLDFNPSQWSEDGDAALIGFPYWGRRLSILLKEVESARRKSGWLLLLKKRFNENGRVMIFIGVLTMVVAIVAVVYQARPGAADVKSRGDEAGRCGKANETYDGSIML
ncbi:hypothetical protein FB567DRAFT_581361 [Paraphoma chrysanthemicola]|uniref:Uncharacterized protein n=1 Tax=Paraphoma chrysanthemicola TaxID=798071 RepID=A0A8K0VXJ2_9PLEO|nr:hypothetical protein FB567DRAFT_581361 [Paraphoma chrysanthemicola]